AGSATVPASLTGRQDQRAVDAPGCKAGVPRVGHETEAPVLVVDQPGERTEQQPGAAGSQSAASQRRARASEQRMLLAFRRDGQGRETGKAEEGSKQVHQCWPAGSAAVPYRAVLVRKR